MHTPGPWKWRDGYCGLMGPEGHADVLRHADYEGMWVPDYDDNGEANARLIAAAPELLEALKEAVRILERLDTLRHIDPSYPALDNARAVIAKAGG